MDQIAEENRIFLSTDVFEERDRGALVRDFYGRICMRLDLEPLERDDLRLKAATTVLPGMSVTQGAVAPMSWERNASLMTDGNDDLVVSWISGGYRFDTRGRATVETTPGAGCLMPLSEPWRAVAENGDWTVCVQVARGLLAPLLDDIGDLTPDAIHPDKPEGRLLLDYVTAVARTPLGPALAPLVSQHIADLLALALGTAGDAKRAAEGRGGQAARLRALKQYVEEHLHRPRLSAEMAGRALGIGPRTIRRLFAAEGQSFSDYVIARRLEWVSRRLSDPRYVRHSIADLALEGGWVEPSTFYRHFKVRFGMKPSDARLNPAHGSAARSPPIHERDATSLVLR